MTGRSNRLETPPHGSRYISSYQNWDIQKTIFHLTPWAGAVLAVAENQMNGAGHAAFGATLEEKLSDFRGWEITQSTLSKALTELKAARLITPNSTRQCVVIYADVHQRGESTFCNYCGKGQERQWWAGFSPAQLRTIQISGHHKVLADGDTGEVAWALGYGRMSA